MMTTTEFILAILAVVLFWHLLIVFFMEIDLRKIFEQGIPMQITLDLHRLEDNIHLLGNQINRLTDSIDKLEDKILWPNEEHHS